MKFKTLAGILLAFLFVFGMSFDASAQGRGGGRGNGNGGGRPTGSPGVDRGLGTASERSGGRSDRGLGTASDNSNGRSDAGLERARAARENGRQADREIERNPRIADDLNMNANDLRSQYQTALADNPNLKFGQFVAANRLSRNLGERYPNVTTSAILEGLASGNSIGQTLQSLGLNKSESKAAEKKVERGIKESKQRQ